MSSVGETLHRERLRRNLDLEAVSRELKISSRMLEAIEAEKFDKLPGGVFAKSFVRQYARLLGLDEEEMANEVQRALSPQPDLPRFAEGKAAGAAPIPLPRLEQWEAVSDEPRSWSSPLPALALLVVAVMACSGVYAWWQHEHRPGARQTAAVHAAAEPAVQHPAVQAPAAEPSSIQPSPAQPTAAGPQLAEQQAARQAEPAAAPAEANAHAVPPAQTAAAPQTKPTGAAEIQPGVAQTKPGEPPPQTALPSNPNAPVRVQVTADEPVWVLARTDGKYLFSGTLDANQSRTVEANGNVLLRLGNAGGVTILLNGKPIGAVGPKGQVRTVELTPGGFQVTAPQKPPQSYDPLINHF